MTTTRRIIYKPDIECATSNDRYILRPWSTEQTNGLHLTLSEVKQILLNARIVTLAVNLLLHRQWDNFYILENGGKITMRFDALDVESVTREPIDRSIDLLDDLNNWCEARALLISSATRELPNGEQSVSTDPRVTAAHKILIKVNERVAPDGRSLGTVYANLVAAMARTNPITYTVYRRDGSPMRIMIPARSQLFGAELSRNSVAAPSPSNPMLDVAGIQRGVEVRTVLGKRFIVKPGSGAEGLHSGTEIRYSMIDTSPIRWWFSID